MLPPEIIKRGIDKKLIERRNGILRLFYYKQNHFFPSQTTLFKKDSIRFLRLRAQTHKTSLQMLIKSLNCYLCFPLTSYF